jgi:predicted outer membrane protein
MRRRGAGRTRARPNINCRRCERVGLSATPSAAQENPKKEFVMSLSRRAVLAAGAVAAIPAVLSMPSIVRAADDDSLDAQLATWMLTDGHKQIWVSKPAAEKATSPEVKAFAEAEMQEHQELKAKIMAKGVKPLVTVGEEGMGMKSGPTALLGFKNELALQCIKTMNAEMEQKSGKEYDEAYVHSQLVAHMDLKSTVTVAMQHASADMKPILTQAMSVIETHLSTLKGLHKNMMKM